MTLAMLRRLAPVLALILAGCVRRTGPGALSPQAELKSFRIGDDLNIELFFSVVDAQQNFWEWQRDYNEPRPHSSVGKHSPLGSSGPTGS